MLSTFSHGSPYESMLENPFPVFEPTSTPWDSQEHLFQLHEPARIDVFNSPKQSSVNRELDPEAKEQDRQEPGEKVEVIDERKRRRMESNRLSARRSRRRKEKHIENLRNMVNKLRVENRDLSNQFRFTVHEVNRVQIENFNLEKEHTILRHKLWCIRQALILRQIGYNNSFEQQQIISPNLILNNNKNNLINC